MKLFNGKNTKLIVIIFSVVLSFCLLMSVLLIFTGYFLSNNISAPVGPIQKQLAVLNEGKIKLAYAEYTSNVFKSETNVNDFSSLVKQNPQIFKSKCASFNNVEVLDNQATVSGTITGKDGTVTPMTYNLVFEKGKWLIVGFSKTSTVKN